MGISAYHLLRKQHLDFFTRSFRLGLVVGTVSAFWVILEGDMHAKHVTKVQSAKLAAMESLWDSTPQAPVYLFAVPDEQNERNSVEIVAIPGVLSFLGHGDFNAKVTGLKEIPKDQRPPVLLTFLSFRAMVALGTYFAVMMLIGIFIRKRLLPFLGKTEGDRRVMVNTMGPLWDGNQVWLLSAGGVTFAAFPRGYAVMFSSLYSALMLILFALILRGVAFEFRSKVHKGVYQGTLFTLLNPYGLIGGMLFVLLFLVHGALWLAARSEGELQARAAATAAGIWVAEVLVAVVFLAASHFTTSLHANYLANPLLFAVILLTVAALFGIRVFLAQQAFFKAWFASALTIVGATFYGVIGLFPNMFPSSLDPAWSLTAHNASSTQLALTIMLVVVIIFVPIVLVYQAWAYNLFKTKVTLEDLAY